MRPSNCYKCGAAVRKYVARIGGVIVAPATALRALRGAPAGQGARDVFWLLLAHLLVFDMAGLAAAVARGWDYGLAYTVGALVAVIGHLLPDMLVIVVGGLALTVFTRRREMKAEEATPYDLAAYAWVPYFATQLAFSILGVGLTMAGVFLPVWFDKLGEVLGIGCGVVVWSVALWVLLGEPRPALALSRAARLAGAGLLFLLALVGVARGRVVAARWSELTAVATPKGKPAPEVNLPLLGGGRFVLSGARGKVVLLDFWATWCAPCRRELPSLMSLSQRFGARGLQVIAINTEGPRARAEVERFVAQQQLTLPVALDDGDVGARYRVETIPHGVLIDAEGMVAKIFVGAASESSLAAAVEAVLPKQ